MSTPDLTTATVAYGRPELTLACVAAVLADARATGVSVEVIVVDASPDPSDRRRIRDGVPPEVKVLDRGDNPGFGAATNAAFALGSGRHLLALNPDVRVEPGALARTVRRLDGDPSIGALGAALYRPDGSMEASWGPPATLRALACAATRAELLARWLPALAGVKAPLPRDRAGTGDAEDRAVPKGPGATADTRPTHTAPPHAPTPVGWVTGAYLALRREALLLTGGFDPRYFLYCEDVDLCERIRRDGLRVVRDPTIRAVHDGGGTTRPGCPRRHGDHWRSWIVYARRWWGPGGAAGTRLLVGLGAAVRAVEALACLALRPGSHRERWRVAGAMASVALRPVRPGPAQPPAGIPSRSLRPTSPRSAPAATPRT